MKRPIALHRCRVVADDDDLHEMGIASARRRRRRRLSPGWVNGLAPAAGSCLLRPLAGRSVSLMVIKAAQLVVAWSRTKPCVARKSIHPSGGSSLRNAGRRRRAHTNNARRLHLCCCCRCRWRRRRCSAQRHCARLLVRCSGESAASCALAVAHSRARAAAAAGESEALRSLAPPRPV